MSETIDLAKNPAEVPNVQEYDLSILDESSSRRERRRGDQVFCVEGKLEFMDEVEVDGLGIVRPIMIAEVSAPGSDSKDALLLTVDVDEETGERTPKAYLAEVTEEGYFLQNKVHVKANGYGVEVGDAELKFTSGKDGNLEVRAEKAINASQTPGVKLIVSPDSVFHTEYAGKAERKAERRERARGDVKWLGRTGLKLAAVYLVLSSGGALDKLADEAFEAEDTVEGVASDYGLDSDSSDYDRVRLNEATERVARLMQDLDDHNYDAIQTRAEAFKDKMVEWGYLVEDQAETDLVFERLDEASSIEELVTIAEEHLSVNNFHISTENTVEGSRFESLNDDASPDDVRRTVKTIIATIGWLPADFVSNELGSPKFILASSPSGFSGLTTGGEAGLGYGSSIVIPVRSKVGESLSSTIGHLDKLAGSGNDLEHAIWHEIGHLFDEYNHNEIPNTDRLFPDIDQDERAIGSIVHIARKIAQLPDQQSVYSHYSEAESFAETFALMFYSQVHPDETRLFESGANRKALALLLYIDQKYPGMADYIITQQDHLMSRSLFDVGRSARFLGIPGTQ